jgi:iron complex transport system permease protein
MMRAIEAERGVSQRHPSSAVAITALIAVAAILVGIGLGPVAISPPEALAIAAAQLGMGERAALDPLHVAVFESIRLPRVLMGFLAGGALAVAGAALQGVFRNPLADPGLIGVSAGAAFGAVCVIVFGPRVFATLTPVALAWALPAAAFVCGLLATAIVYAAARHEGRVIIPTMLLAGVALSAIAMAGIGWLTFLADDAQLRTLTFWTMGSVGGATWAQIAPSAVLILGAGLVLFALARPLDALAFGEDGARHLGFDSDRTTMMAAGAGAVAVAAAVAACGVIGFIGLVAPHLVRLVAGPRHAIVLPAAGLVGGALVVLADTLARLVVAPAELPLGVVTALIGGPFFFWLLLRHKGRRLA